MMRDMFVRWVIGTVAVLASGCSKGPSSNPGAPVDAGPGEVVVRPAAPRAPDDPKAARRVAVRAAQMLDVKSGTSTKDAIILVEGERISAVGPGLSIPAGVKVIDLGAATVLPGLIDCHTHLLMR